MTLDKTCNADVRWQNKIPVPVVYRGPPSTPVQPISFLPFLASSFSLSLSLSLSISSPSPLVSSRRDASIAASAERIIPNCTFAGIARYKIVGRREGSLCGERVRSKVDEARGARAGFTAHKGIVARRAAKNGNNSMTPARDEFALRTTETQIPRS
jgi:hypothetical protein